jgi:hypothetical protein
VLREAELAANVVGEEECDKGDAAKLPLFVHGSHLADIYPGEGYDPAVMYKLADLGVLVRTEIGPVRWRVRYELAGREPEEYNEERDTV